MHGLFSYDSKFAQVMSFVADLLILNVLFLLCCLPIVTIGAAQAGLYTAVRRLEDPTDGRSCYKAFFEGFKNGFLRITVTHIIFLVLIAVAFWSMVIAFQAKDTGLLVHWAVPCVVLVILMILQALSTVFHSQFDCTAFNLIRNSLMLLVTHPLRSILVAALSWAPALLFYLVPDWFLKLGALFVAAYYSIAFLFSVVLLKKPFNVLMNAMEQDEEKE